MDQKRKYACAGNKRWLEKSRTFQKGRDFWESGGRAQRAVGLGSIGNRGA